MFPAWRRVNNTVWVYRMHCNSSGMKIFARQKYLQEEQYLWFPLNFKVMGGGNFLSKNSYGFGIMPETSSQHEFCFPKKPEPDCL